VSTRESTAPAANWHDITSYDVLKTLAVFLMIVDHVGFFFYPDIEMLRVIGRLSAPIWFFLIGFARARDVPFSWMFWFVTDLVLSVSLGFEAKANVLLTLALVRLSLDAIGPLLIPRNHFTIAFFVFALVLTPLSQNWLDYGAYAWPLAAIGYWARTDGTKGWPWMAAVLFGYFAIESLHFDFSDAAMIVFAGGLVCLMALLATFDPNARMRVSTGWTAALYHFCGHYSLIIYVLHFMALKILWSFAH
jgi:hypothetical protein